MKVTDHHEDRVFPWYDEHYLSWRKPDPLAVAARALALAEYHHATAQEHGDDSAWFVYGLACTAKALAAGDLGALGVLLTGLETLVPAQDRAKWPLSELVGQQTTPSVTTFVTNGVEPAIGVPH